MQLLSPHPTTPRASHLEWASTTTWKLARQGRAILLQLRDERISLCVRKYGAAAVGPTLSGG